MASSPPPYNNGRHSQILPNAEEPPNSAIVFRRTGRRTSSLSSSSSWDSSFGSFSEEFPPFTPNSPLKFKGVPFSWEQIPGIPKRQLSKKKEFSSDHLLPLPPAGTSTTSTTKKLLHHHETEISPKKTSRCQKDPFFAALVQCSKDDDDDNDEDDHITKGSSKITRTLSDRFGFINMYTSCKRTCPVSESIVYLPRQQSSHYNLLNRRST